MATQASKASTTTAPAAAPASVTVNIQTPASQKLLIARCAKDRSRLVGVLRPNGLYYLYNYDSDLDKMIPHVCSCQVKATEVNLQPKYSAHSEKLGCTVIFMFNTITHKTEQYVYRFETDHFEEVENTGLVYNSTQNSYHYVVAVLKGPNDEQVMIERDNTGSLRKLIWRGGAFKVMASSRVESLMMKLLAIQNETEDDDDSSEYDSDESDSDSEDDGEDVVFDNYIDSIDSLVLVSCTHQNVIIAFNYNTYEYRGFTYNESSGDFQHMECRCESELTISERHLTPKYADFCTINKVYVLHVYNTITGVMEKYCLAGNGLLKQVDYPDLAYNPVKVSTSPVMLVSTLRTSTIVFLKDTNGRLSREIFCPAQLRYVTATAEPVKTFIVQKKEAEKMKKEERKEEALKKAAQEKERQEQEALQKAAQKKERQDQEALRKAAQEKERQDQEALKKAAEEKERQDQEALKKAAQEKERQEQEALQKAAQEKERQDQEALQKAAQEQERHDQEALVQALAAETLQTAERIAKRSTEKAAEFRKQRAENLEKEEKEALDALKKTMAEAVNGPVEDQKKQRDGLDFLEFELEKLSCCPAPAVFPVPVKPARVPKVNWTSKVVQTDISRQIARPLDKSPTARADAIKKQLRFEGLPNIDMNSSYKPATGPKTDMPNKF